MKYLLKNADLYTPKHLGLQDVLIENGKISKIDNVINENCEIIDCKGKIVCPMFVDGHQHLLGDYWSEEGIIEAGVGSIVACLANEPEPKFVDKLIEITTRLKEEYNIDAYCLSGSKNCLWDSYNYIVQYNNVIGIKTALFQPQRPKPNLSYEKLKEDALNVYRAGKLSGKTVQVHVHLDNPFAARQIVTREEINSGELDNLCWIDKIVKETGVPYSLFKLTHAQKYYERIIEYANKGCFIDYTAFSGAYDERFNCLVDAIKNKAVDASRISISSDLGILTIERGLSSEEKPLSLLNTMQKLIKEKGLTLEQVLPMITSNVGILLSGGVGKLDVGSVAKLLILDKDLTIETIVLKDKQANLNFVK